MLTDLRVSHFAIIDQIDIAFANGLNVVSGETGSGKSIPLRALSLMMGEKSQADFIKAGESQATVEAAFDISNRTDIKERIWSGGYSDAAKSKDVEDTVVVRRIFSTDGKNKVFVNGRLSTLQLLKEIVSPLIEVTGQPAPLIEMTGQHENRNLQSKIYHMEMLDSYLGLTPSRTEASNLYNDIQILKEKISTLEESLKVRTQRLDFITYQRDEISALNLQPNEDEELTAAVRRAREASKYIHFLELAEAGLDTDEDSVLARLHKILQKGTELSIHDSRLKTILEPLQTARTLVDESLLDLRDYSRNLSLDPDELNEKEERLSQIRKLQKKFGPSIEVILQEWTKINEEIETLENSDQSLQEFKSELDKKISLMTEKSKTLHKKRLKGSLTLTQSVNAELAELNMKGVLFSVHMQELKEFNSYGSTDLEFMIQNSKNDTARAIAKFASGGELSRIMLALKRVAGNNELPRTYIFDEVDAGVSGVTAEKVGKKLKSIAKGQQVICVTHLLQVAAFADAHYSIYKTTAKTGAKMKIDHLNKEDRIQEIARMLSGEKITAASLANAKELTKHS